MEIENLVGQTVTFAGQKYWIESVSRKGWPLGDDGRVEFCLDGRERIRTEKTEGTEGYQVVEGKMREMTDDEALGEVWAVAPEPVLWHLMRRLARLQALEGNGIRVAPREG